MIAARVGCSALFVRSSTPSHRLFTPELQCNPGAKLRISQGCANVLRNVSFELRSVSFELRNVIYELRNVSLELRNVSLEILRNISLELPSLPRGRY